jgi:hypothetical protein
MSALFWYVCRSTAHQDSHGLRSDERVALNPITIHDGRWSYCPSGSATSHTWEPVHGCTLDEVRMGHAVAGSFM